VACDSISVADREFFCIWDGNWLHPGLFLAPQDGLLELDMKVLVAALADCTETHLVRI